MNIRTFWNIILFILEKNIFVIRYTIFFFIHFIYSTLLFYTFHFLVRRFTLEVEKTMKCHYKYQQFLKKLFPLQNYIKEKKENKLPSQKV